MWVMQRAITLLHTLVVNDLSEYIGRVEGDYDIFIPGLNRIRYCLNLAPNHGRCSKTSTHAPYFPVSNFLKTLPSL